MKDAALWPVAPDWINGLVDFAQFAHFILNLVLDVQSLPKWAPAHLKQAGLLALHSEIRWPKL